MKIRNILTSLFATVTAACAAAAEPDNMQQLCDKTLPAAMNEYNAESACAVVVSVTDGKVLATTECATEGAIAPLRLHGRTRVGMLVQPIILSGALESGKVTVNNLISCAPLQITESMQLTDHPFNYGVLTCGQVIKKSSVPGTGRMITIAGAETLANQFTALGLPWPASDSLPELFSIVTDSMATPMELVAAYTAIGREGKFASIAANGKPSPSAENAMKPATATAVLQALESCTEYRGAAGRGTALAAAIPGYRVACKTATIHSQSDKKSTDVGAVLMLPADKPQLIVLVLMQNVKPNHVAPAGNSVAAPVAKQIAVQGIKLFNIAPTK